MMVLVRRYTDTLAELFAIYAAILVAAAAGFAVLEHHGFWISLWWAVTTAMTIGCSIEPVTPAGRVIGGALLHLVLFGVGPLIVVHLTRRVLADRDAFTHEEQESILASLARLEKRDPVSLGRMARAHYEARSTKLNIPRAGIIWCRWDELPEPQQLREVEAMRLAFAAADRVTR